MRVTTAHSLRSRTILAVLSVLVLLFTGCAGPTGTLPREPVNMILFIGDGMGYEQLKAASLYETGQEEALFIQGLSIQTTLTTYSASDDITDSAGRLVLGSTRTNSVLGNAS